jgi:hypothetical protein
MTGELSGCAEASSGMRLDIARARRRFSSMRDEGPYDLKLRGQERLSCCLNSKSQNPGG